MSNDPEDFDEYEEEDETPTSSLNTQLYCVWTFRALLLIAGVVLVLHNKSNEAEYCFGALIVSFFFL